MARMDTKRLERFKREIWAHYRKHGREMPWRSNTSSYFVVVSEIMLQQTQVDRVKIKFASFIRRFPDWKSLARASTYEVLQEWSGLGYNRRGLYLKEIAQVVAQEGEGYLDSKEHLLELPGIGPNTAGSILAFAFNEPVPFIETNIRSVFIHSFFKGAKKKISDSDILPLIEKTLDRENPREWQYALMDYGSYLKKRHPNPSRKSVHYVKQSTLKGSNRELRSNILKMVMAKKASRPSVIKRFGGAWNKAQIEKNLRDLEKEGFIENNKGILTIVE